MREIRIDHNRIQNSQTITDVVSNEFKSNDLDIHRHEVMELIDDDKKGQRILKIKSTKYFSVPELPWKK